MKKTTFKKLFMSGTLVASLLFSSATINAQELIQPENVRRDISGVIINKDNGKPLFRNMPIPKDSQSLGNLKKQLNAPHTLNDSDIPVITVVDEDFVNFSAGTEDVPDSEMICDYDTWSIPDSYFHQPGWTGMGVQQAGGTCALAYPNYGGCINTPFGDYQGSINIKFRIKALSTNRYDKVSIGVGLCYDEYEANIIGYKNIEAYKGIWTEYNLTFISTYGGLDAFVQFNSYDDVIIDDVKVTKQQNYIAEPALKSATNFTYDGFTANWGEVGGANQYLLPVYKQVPTSNEEYINFFEDFSSVTDELPEGWTYNRGAGNSDILYNNPDSLVHNAIWLLDGDTIALPNNGGLITAFEFDFISANIPPTDGYNDLPGTIYCEGWDGYRWKNNGYIYLGYHIVADKMIRHFNFSSISGKFYSYRFRVEEIGEDVGFAIDNVSWTTTSPTEREYEFEEMPLTETSYTLTGLDPVADYYYTVRAENTESGIISEGPTQCMDAFGLAAPYIFEASDIDPRGGYTANWDAAPKATSYSIENFDVFTAPDAIDGYMVMRDDFTKLDNVSYTPSQPYAFNNMSMALLDELTDRKGWYGYLCGYAQGAIAGIGIPAYGIGGQIQSPELSLNNNGGKFRVEITACGTSGDYLQVFLASSRIGISCQLSEQYKVFSAEIDGGQLNDILVFQTSYKTAFFISSVKVIQDLEEGDKSYELIEEIREDGNSNTNHRFSGLQRRDNYSYAYNVYSVYKRYSQTAWSERSEREHVDLNGGTGLEVIEGKPVEVIETERYNIEGIRISAPQKGLNIIKYSDGTTKKEMIK